MEDLVMMDLNGNSMKSIYTFCREDALFVDTLTFLFILAIVPLSGFAAYTCIFYADMYLQIFPIYFWLIIIGTICFVFYCFCEDMYGRWLAFKFNESTTLQIDVELGLFTYRHDNKEVIFHSNNVKEWSWNTYGMVGYSPVVEVVDIRLKSGERIVIPSGIGNVLDFMQENWKELGLPKGRRNHESIRTYMKMIKAQQDNSK